MHSGGLFPFWAGRLSLESTGPRTSRSRHPAQLRQDSGHVPVLPTALCICLERCASPLGVVVMYIVRRPGDGSRRHLYLAVREATATRGLPHPLLSPIPSGQCHDIPLSHSVLLRVHHRWTLAHTCAFLLLALVCVLPRGAAQDLQSVHPHLSVLDCAFDGTSNSHIQS
jgi:hypothetical protein